MNSIWRFGLFELDAQAGELRKEGRRVKLQDQPFQILVRLVRRPGELVTREELQSVWGEDTFVDFDLGLNTAIKKIRVALGDSADNPRFVETIPRKGYRFIAPVAEVAAVAPELPAAPSETKAEAPVAAPPRKHRMPLALGIAAALAGGVWYFASHSARPEVFQFGTPLPLTAYPGIESQPAISRDGQLVAFSWNGKSPDVAAPELTNIDIYVRQKGVDEPRRLTSNLEDDLWPAFSPDGKQLAFARVKKQNSQFGPYEIMVMPTSGGVEARVATALPSDGGECPPATWSPDGRFLVVRGTINRHIALLRIPLAGGEPQVMVTPVAEANDSCPAFSPDGKTLAFTRSGWGGFSEVYVQPLTPEQTPAGSPRRTPKIGFALGSAWLPDNRTLLVAESGEHFWKVPVSGGEPVRLDVLGGGVSHPAISASGSLVYAVTNAATSHLSVITAVDLKGGAPPRAVLASTRGETSPRYSPDGKRIVFTSNRSGSSEVWVSNADGSEATRLTSLGPEGMRGWPNWSPDGSKIVFDSTNAREGRARTWHVFVVSATGGNPVQLTTADATNGVAGWSRDGKSIYYYSNSSGSDQIWKIPAAGGKPVQITKNGGRLAMESPDGRYYYYTQGYRDLWRIPVEGGEEVPILKDAWAFHFKPVADGIYHVVQEPKESQSIRFYSFDTRRDTVVLSIPGQNVGPALEVSPDGRTLLYSRKKDAETDLMQVTLNR